MEREPVRSSNIVSIGYDAYARVLEIEFRTGSVYQLLEVPQHEYEALITADSIGSYFNFNIRDMYDYRLIYKPK